MPLAIAILIAAVGIGYAMSRVAKVRKELADIAEVEPRPKRQSRREKRLEQIRAAEPEYVPPSIDDLVAAEVADTGVDRIPGGEGVALAVLLKVYRRDTGVAETCAPEDRRFVITPGVAAADAGLDAVRLICASHPSSAGVHGPETAGEKEFGDSAD